VELIEPFAYNIIAAVRSDAGCHRQVNEDHCLYRPPNGDGRGALAIVADGMGGHAAGEVASRMAVEIINRVYYANGAGAATALEKAFREANRMIHRAARSDARLSGMGTTCTALALRDGAAFCAHVGDSRLYLARGGEIYLMSEDHSAVMELVRRGLMSREVARNHADRNIILRALGTRPEADVTIWQEPFPVRSGDCFVLCSDGLSDQVADEEIKRIVMSSDLDAACEQLIALAKERGGHDNITVGVLKVAASE
jgi:protein phosphatase